jgi:hypothetical protein
MLPMDLCVRSDNATTTFLESLRGKSLGDRMSKVEGMRAHCSSQVRLPLFAPVRGSWPAASVCALTVSSYHGTRISRIRTKQLQIRAGGNSNLTRSQFSIRLVAVRLRGWPSGWPSHPLRFLSDFAQAKFWHFCSVVYRFIETLR